MALHDARIDVPFLTLDGDAYLATLATPEFYDLAEGGVVARIVVTPILAGAAPPIVSRLVVTPILAGVGDQFLFLLRWDVDVRLSERFLLDWVVLRESIAGSLFLLQWDVIRPLEPMLLIWQVIEPAILDGFAAELVSPAASATRTPDL